MPMTSFDLVVGEWKEITWPDTTGLGTFYYDSDDPCIAAVERSTPATLSDVGYVVTRGVNSIPIAPGKKLFVKLISGAAEITWAQTEGYSVYQWLADTAEWTLVENACAAGYEPVEPSTSGTYGGQTAQTFCTLTGAGSALFRWVGPVPGGLWTLISDDCESGYTATEPSTDGTYSNEERYGTCEL